MKQTTKTNGLCRLGISLRNSKKAQIAGQVFIFILAAGLAVMILLYGYNAISSFTERTEDIAFINFKTDLQNEIRTIASDYGSVKKLDLQMPGRYEMLCLIDLNYPDSDKSNTCLCKRCPDKQKDFNPEVCDAWTTPGNQDNAFLIPITPIKTSIIRIEDPVTKNQPGYICIAPRGSKVSLRLEGRGDATKVSEWI